jgi:uncharacterized protein YecT (DUF1311 family)
MILRTLVAASLLLLPVPTFAEAVCGASGACDGMGSNVEYKECLAKLADDEDKELNRLYKQVQARLAALDGASTSSPKTSPAFTAAQKAWLTFRDRQCEVEYGVAQGGTAGGGYYSDCVCHLTHHRNEDLRRMLSSYGE